MTGKKKSVMESLFVEDDEIQKKLETEAENEEVVIPSGNVNVVHLPSNGLLGYPDKVEYREMLVSDEEILAGATADTYALTLNSVLKSVLNDCPFYEKLTLADRDFALLWVWANNYTAIKEVSVVCSHCDHGHFVQKVDLTKLEQIPIKENIKKNIPKVFELSNGGKITVNMITVADELFVEEYSKKNPNVRVEHALLVRSIDVGIKIPFDKKLEWVSNNITAKEIGLIRKLHAHFFYGVKTIIGYTCPACKGVTHDEIPFQAEDVLYPVVSEDITDFILD